MTTASSRSKTNQDREPRRRALTPLGDAMRSFLDDSGLASRVRQARTFEAWNAAAGEDLARRAAPVAFRAGELVVEVSSSAHLGELRGFTGEELRRAANARLGGERIRRVVYRIPR